MPPRALPRQSLLLLWAEERVGFDEPPNRIRLLERIVELRRWNGSTARGQTFEQMSDV